MPVEFGPIKIGRRKPPISLEPIAQIEGEVRSIVSEIKRDGKRYDLIIADDTSGRIPTLVIGKVLNRLDREQSAALRFVYRWKEIEPVLGHLTCLPQRALLVTEYISSGQTIYQCGRILTREGINFDIAALRSCYDEHRLRLYHYIPESTSIYIGDINKEISAIYSRSDLTGLERHEDILHRVRKTPEAREVTRKARRDVAVLIDRVVGDFKEPSIVSGKK